MIFFVVPAQLYDNYKKQKFVTTNNNIVRRIPSWIKNRVKQHALRIDLSGKGDDGSGDGGDNGSENVGGGDDGPENVGESDDGSGNVSEGNVSAKKTKKRKKRAK